MLDTKALTCLFTVITTTPKYLHVRNSGEYLNFCFNVERIVSLLWVIETYNKFSRIDFETCRKRRLVEILLERLFQ